MGGDCVRKIDVETRVALIGNIKKEIKNSFNGKYYHRLCIVLLCMNGSKVSEVSKLFDENVGTINYWIREVVSGGVAALKNEKIPGRPSRLIFSQKQQIDTALSQSPMNYGYKDVLWDGNLLSDYINKAFNISLATRQCQRLMCELGYTMQRPRIFPNGSNSEAREEFKKR